MINNRFFILNPGYTQVKVLKNYWVKGDRSKLPSTMIRKIEMVMEIIDSIEKVPDDLYPFPELKPHPLKGNRKGDWSLEISSNWRITFTIMTTKLGLHTIWI